MTKKDFLLIADVIKGMPGDEVLDKESVAQAFAMRLKLVNPALKTDRFLVMCGIPASSATCRGLVINKE